MGKPRMLGMVNRCITNSKADMRYRRKTFERNKGKVKPERRKVICCDKEKVC